MNVQFTKNALEEYIYWQTTDKNTLKLINKLIRDCQRGPSDGLGKPEKLKENLTGYWSRHITGEHRLVYRFDANTIYIIQCRYHYTKK